MATPQQIQRKKEQDLLRKTQVSLGDALGAIDTLIEECKTRSTQVKSGSQHPLEYHHKMQVLRTAKDRIKDLV